MNKILDFSYLAVTVPVGVVLVGSFLFFYTRAFRFRSQLLRLKIRHSREIEAVQKEIYRQTLEAISRELHDDLGQRLSIVKLRLNAILPDITGDAYTLLKETKEMTAELLQDLRSLTRYLHVNSSRDILLPEVIQEELDRIKRSKLLVTSLTIEGIPRTFDGKTSLILFRIFQEGLNNVVAHAQARCCDVRLHYGRTALLFRMRDDGIGFSATQGPASHTKGLGLKNMAQRSDLINAQLAIESKLAVGTTISICVPYPSSTSEDQ